MQSTQYKYLSSLYRYLVNQQRELMVTLSESQIVPDELLANRRLQEGYFYNYPLTGRTCGNMRLQYDDPEEDRKRGNYRLSFSVPAGTTSDILVAIYREETTNKNDSIEPPPARDYQVFAIRKEEKEGVYFSLRAAALATTYRDLCREILIGQRQIAQQRINEVEIDHELADYLTNLRPYAETALSNVIEGLDIGVLKDVIA